MTLAALCHFYPGYDFDRLRALPLDEFNILVDCMNEANKHG